MRSASSCCTPRDLGGQVPEGFGDPWNNLVIGNPWTLYWIQFVRGGVAGISQRPRYIETLADIERTSLAIMRQFARFIGSGESRWRIP
jgi:hypothetical protein